jgi:murein DD-endopeptidase MepM/ murein hydrolase activator NlpD
MRVFKSINSWFGKIAGKRHISVTSNGEERWHADISPMMFTTICVAIISLIFGAVLLLVAYTPLLNFVPGYSAKVARSREALTQNIVRLDSLEHKMNEMLVYNENRLLVMSGRTPAMQSVKNDSLRTNKKFVAPSKEDSLLRQKVENDKRYRLVDPNLTTLNKENTVAPMAGEIVEQFNSQSHLSIRIRGEKEASVLAVAEGVVVLTEGTPETEYSVAVQHKDNYLSVYRNLSTLSVSKGERVQSEQAVGYAKNGEDEKSVLEFELWSDGQAVNPELYIEF